MEYDDYPVVEPYVDEATFTMNGIIDYDILDQFSEANPSSKEYRKLMRKLGINGRSNYGTRKSVYDDEW